jgi:formylglycine-generating enzyme required for sulfatase activity
VFSPLEQEFLHASRTLLKRAQRAAQLRWAGLAMTAGLILLIVTLAVTGQLNPYIYRPVDMQDYWVTIPAGEFQMGSEIGEDDEKPIHTVMLDAFEIGRFEVTNRQYAQCVKAGICNPSDEQRYEAKADPLEPVVAISWFDANTFCTWLDARLPTEAQWEKAARGGLTGKLYSWGDEEPTCDAGASNGANFRTDACGYYLEPVGTYAGNGYGLYDMAGNVWEWTADWYDPNYYEVRENSNPFGPFESVTKVLRGGSWNYSGLALRVSDRFDFNPDLRYDYVGFRCAK